MRSTKLNTLLILHLAVR